MSPAAPPNGVGPPPAQHLQSTHAPAQSDAGMPTRARLEHGPSRPVSQQLQLQPTSPEVSPRLSSVEYVAPAADDQHPDAAAQRKKLDPSRLAAFTRGSPEVQSLSTFPRSPSPNTPPTTSDVRLLPHASSSPSLSASATFASNPSLVNGAGITAPGSSPAAAVTPPAVASSTTKERDRVCAKCGLPMAGQFVRALGTVFHLDCFRCQVSLQVSLRRFACWLNGLSPCLCHAGLQQDCCGKILSCGRSRRKAIPTLRDRLLPPAKSAVCEMWRCPAW
jgi:hypothetical protein